MSRTCNNPVPSRYGLYCLSSATKSKRVLRESKRRRCNAKVCLGKNGHACHLFRLSIRKQVHYVIVIGRISSTLCEVLPHQTARAASFGTSITDDSH